MSGLETLPPDQRAVLQLILAQGRGYAELAGLLKIDAAAVRTRAHAGLEALAAADPAPDLEQRAQIADYLLGQQDDGERLVTLVALGESAPAAQWASALRQQLTPLARDPLPEVPEPVSSNGAAPSPPPARPPTPAPAPVAATRAPAAATAAAPTPPPPAPPAAPAPAEAASAPGTRPSRLGGALLLVAAAVVVAVLAIVLIGGGDDDPATGSTGPNASSTPSQTTTTGQPTGQFVAQVNLLATPAGGQAAGIGLVEQVDGRQAIAIQAEKLSANGAQDIYAAWLSGAPGTKLLGFVPHQVKANGTFTVSAELPANASRYDTVLITRESATGGNVPTQPGQTIMRGALKLP